MVSGIRKKGRSCPLKDVCLPPEMGYPGLASSQAECSKSFPQDQGGWALTRVLN